jgi:large subunit ribosomal protein L18
MKTSAKLINRKARQARVRAKVSGSSERPRLMVYRSNVAIYAYLIDDVAKKTLGSTSDLHQKNGTKVESAAVVGKEIAKIAKEKNISSVVFDRAGYKYHGRVKALADAAREGGLEF